MQTVPEIVVEDIPIEEYTNYGGSSIHDSGSDDSGSSDHEQSASQIDLLNELDVILVFLRSKSQLFQYSALRAENCRFAVYLVSLLCSGSITVLPLLATYERWLLILISVFGALTTGTIVVSRYADFDITIQKYNMTSKSYTLLETELTTFKSVNTYSFSYDKYRALYEKIRESEMKILELNNHAELSLSVKRRFPIISTMDIFAEIYKIEDQRKVLSKRETKVRYEMRKLAFDIDSANIDPQKKSRLKYLQDSKKKIKDDLDKINYTDIVRDIECERRDYSDSCWFIHL
jgi:hypothetical protein